jgi:formylglycine-generating enzyme required for sulfatase activity
VLYELLAGAPPRSREELTRLERETDWPAPERPSTKGSRGTDATHVGVDTRTLARATAGDLDLIVLKALHADRSRRYATVESFAADLRRWLDGRPVEARADSLAYRARRYVRRNAIAVGAAAVVFAGLTVGLFVAIDGWNDAVAAQTEAKAAQLRAQNETRKLLQLAARQELQALVAEADELWPLSPELLPRLESWIASAERLVRDTEKHRATLLDLEHPGRDAAPLDEAERQWWKHQVQAHLADLAELTDPAKGRLVDDVNGIGVGIPRRARLIRVAMESRIPGTRDARAWEEARAWVESQPKYAAVKLPVIVGLVPIGPDPQSGLLELAHIASGHVPVRLPDGRLDWNGDSGLVFILLPGGTATIGAQSEDPTGPNYDVATEGQEGPPWSVRFDPFLISKFEMTQGQWGRLEGRNPSSQFRTKADSLMLPVEMVTWVDCRRVLDRYGFVLPTELQWEYAARAGTSTPWWFGAETELLATHANLYDEEGLKLFRTNLSPEAWNDGMRGVSPGYSYPANPFGLHDVIGSVSEWCLDRAASSKIEPTPGRGLRPQVKGTRAIRGGSFRNLAVKSRASYRMQGPPTLSGEHLGVRPAILLVEDGPRWGPEAP